MLQIIMAVYWDFLGEMHVTKASDELRRDMEVPWRDNQGAVISEARSRAHRRRRA